MKIIYLISFFLISSFSVFSQTKEIKQIKELYYSVQENIEQQRNEEIPQDNLQIILNQNMAAIGPQTVSYNFYFTLKFDEEETYEYYHTLNFVTRSYNIAASVYYYEEFLYNDKGELIFYFLKQESEYSFEIRCYYSNNELINITIKDLKEDGNYQNSADYIQTYESTNKIPENHEEDCKFIKLKAENILEIYKKIDNNIF